MEQVSGTSGPQVVYQHLSNVTLFVTTGKGRGFVSPTGEQQHTNESSQPQPQTQPQTQSQENLKESDGQLVSFANVEQAILEEIQVQPILLHSSGCNEGCCAINDEGFAAMEEGILSMIG